MFVLVYVCMQEKAYVLICILPCFCVLLYFISVALNYRQECVVYAKMSATTAKIPYPSTTITTYAAVKAHVLSTPRYENGAFTS